MPTKEARRQCHQLKTCRDLRRCLEISVNGVKPINGRKISMSHELESKIEKLEVSLKENKTRKVQ